MPWQRPRHPLRPVLYSLSAAGTARRSGPCSHHFRCSSCERVRAVRIGAPLGEDATDIASVQPAAPTRPNCRPTTTGPSASSTPLPPQISRRTTHDCPRVQMAPGWPRWLFEILASAGIALVGIGNRLHVGGYPHTLNDSTRVLIASAPGWCTMLSIIAGRTFKVRWTPPPPTAAQWIQMQASTPASTETPEPVPSDLPSPIRTIARGRLLTATTTSIDQRPTGAASP